MGIGGIYNNNTILTINFTPLFIKYTRYNPLIKCFYPEAGQFFILYILFYFGLAGYSFILMHQVAKTSTGQKRNQIRYVMVASALGFLGGASTFLLWYQIKILPYGSHFVWLYAPTITLAILRYRLMDIKLLIKRATILELSFVLQS